MEENNNINEEIIALHFREIMEKGLNLNTNDPNFIDTPKRVARAYKEIFRGLGHTQEDIEKLFNKCFPTKYTGILLEKEITVFSMCPHHFLPIRYEVAVGYIPNGCAVGLSKLTRLVELLSKIPCMQESFTEKIVEELEKHVKPLGVICTVKGAHYCMQMRGVKQKDVVTITSSAKGVFLTDKMLETKFYELLER